MGRSKESKGAILEELKTSLGESQLAMVIDYQGLTVAEISALRRKLRPTGTSCKVTKNTLMRIAIGEDGEWKPMTELLSGTSAFLLVKEDIGGAFKAYQEFKKESKKTEFRGGVMQGQLLTEDQIKAIADLPPKEVLFAQAAGAINTIAAKLARSINEVPSSVARGVNEVPASLGRVLQAVASKDAA
jgi:large subunit ribosomal protein L10